jgi:hypothetical protein
MTKTVLRASLYQFKNGHEQPDDWIHVTHCLDALRQLIICAADPTLDGAGVLHECRDWDGLKKWTEEHAYLEHEYENGLC